MTLYAGAAGTDITPPPGISMGGYIAREGPATGTLDPLKAKALYFHDGRQGAVILCADLVSLDPDLSLRIRRETASALGLDEASVFINCSHTHSGPLTYSFTGMGVRDEAYCDVLARKMIGIAEEAADRVRPASITYGESSAQIGFNRRNRGDAGLVSHGRSLAGLTCPLVQTVSVTRPEGSLIALLFTHACHPVTLGHENRRFSADWPGAAVGFLESRLRGKDSANVYGAEAIAMYAQGCCGDVNPIARGMENDVLENGQAIGAAAHAARWSGRFPGEDSVLTSEYAVELPAAGGATVSFAVQQFRIGGVTMLGFPAEMFVQYQLDFMSAIEGPLLALGNCNASDRYLPTASEWARGGYEVKEAAYYYATPAVTQEAEQILRRAVYEHLGAEASLEPYPPANSADARR